MNIGDEIRQGDWSKGDPMKLFALLLTVSFIVGCESKPTFKGAILGRQYFVMQTWTVVEHNYAKNEFTFIGHNTKDAPSDKGLTLRITARCAPWPENECPFYTGQVLKVTNAVDNKADDSWDENTDASGKMYFAQGEHEYYFEIIKEEVIK
jgi:hypothetical protein